MYNSVQNQRIGPDLQFLFCIISVFIENACKSIKLTIYAKLTAVFFFSGRVWYWFKTSVSQCFSFRLPDKPIEILDGNKKDRFFSPLLWYIYQTDV